MAIKEQDKVFYEELANGDKVINLPVTRANNVEGLGRSANTYYSVGNVVYVDSNLCVALKCTTAGTTSNTELDISGNNIGDTVTDGGVVWEVVGRDLSEALNSLQSNVDNALLKLLPVGTSIMYMGDTVPDGYLAENGAAVSRTTYAKLFAVIGTKHGAGNGSTTFNLPNMNNAKFVTSATANVNGNGGTFYVTDGTNNYGVFMSSNGNGLGTFKNTANVGAAASTVSGANNIGKVVGVSKTKANLVASLPTMTVGKFCIKY